VVADGVGIHLGRRLRSPEYVSRSRVIRHCSLRRTAEDTARYCFGEREREREMEREILTRRQKGEGMKNMEIAKGELGNESFCGSCPRMNRIP